MMSLKTNLLWVIVPMIIPVVVMAVLFLRSYIKFCHEQDRRREEQIEQVARRWQEIENYRGNNREVYQGYLNEITRMGSSTNYHSNPETRSWGIVRDSAGEVVSIGGNTVGYVPPRRPGSTDINRPEGVSMDQVCRFIADSGALVTRFIRDRADKRLEELSQPQSGLPAPETGRKPVERLTSGLGI